LLPAIREIKVMLGLNRSVEPHVTAGQNAAGDREKKSYMSTNTKSYFRYMAIWLGAPLVWGLLASALMEITDWPELSLVASFIGLCFLHYWFAKNWPRELQRVAWLVGVLGGFGIFFLIISIMRIDNEQVAETMVIKLMILVPYLAMLIGFAWFAKRYLPDVEVSGRQAGIVTSQPIISLTPRAPQARQRVAEERLKREAEEQRDARVTSSESLKAEFPVISIGETRPIAEAARLPWADSFDLMKKRAQELERKLREVEAKRR
jgi:hypothetical protein